MNEPTERKTQRPDRAIFKAMMGAFFLLFSVAPAYWAYYNYGEYQRTTAFVQTLRESSGQFLTANELEERKNRIAINGSRADRYKLEMILSGAGAFVLFGIALLLSKGFLKDFRNNETPEFETVDWRTIPMPTERVEVRYKWLHAVLFAFLVLFFGSMATLNFTQTVRSQFSTTSDIVVKGILLNGFLLLIALLISVLMIRARRKSIRLFDASGVRRGDGRHFAWGEFRGVITQIDVNWRTRNRYVWRIELAFDNGETAWLIPSRIKNLGEVMNFIDSLPGTRLKIRA